MQKEMVQKEMVQKERIQKERVLSLNFLKIVVNGFHRLEYMSSFLQYTREANTPSGYIGGTGRGKCGPRDTRHSYIQHFNPSAVQIGITKKKYHMLGNTCMSI